MEHLTYWELVRVGWRLFWRTVGAFMLLVYVATNILLIAMPDLTRSSPPLWASLIPVATATAISVLGFMPMIVRQTIQKPFRGFRLQAVRR
jgi:uncharacterized membrane protein